MKNFGTIKIFKKGDDWYARFPEGSLMEQTFDTREIPTGYKANKDIEEVMCEISKRNPNNIIMKGE